MRYWKRLLIAGAIFLSGCGTNPSDITLRAYGGRSIVVQCEDEHEPVLTVGENRTVGIITCGRTK